jgi:hypothetical protein
MRGECPRGFSFSPKTKSTTSRGHTRLRGDVAGTHTFKGYHVQELALEGWMRWCVSPGPLLPGASPENHGRICTPSGIQVVGRRSLRGSAFPGRSLGTSKRGGEPGNEMDEAANGTWNVPTTVISG